MELVVLVAVVALLIFGPRRGGRMPSHVAMVIGVVFLIWLLAALGFGAIWKSLVGPIAQP